MLQILYHNFTVQNSTELLVPLICCPSEKIANQKLYLRLIGLRYVLFRADQICLGTSGQPALGAHVLDILSQLPIFHYFLDHCVDCIFVGWLGCTSSGGVVIRKVPADP